MKGKIIFTIYSINERSYPEKLNFMRKMIGEYVLFKGDEDYQKSGFISKFNNSYGYKDVQETYDGGAIIAPKIPTPDNYKTPGNLLICNATFLNKKNELMSFIIPGHKVLHPNRKYSYEPMNMLFDFQKFLYKVFPDIRIQFEIKCEDFELSLRDFALGHFMTCFAYCEICETEFSAGKMLKTNEKKYILDVISKVVSFTPTITQYWCDTCFEYHKDSPYHIQVDKKME